MSTFHFTTELRGFELQTRELFNALEIDWTSELQAVANVFVAAYSRSLSVEDVCQIASLLNGQRLDAEQAVKELARLVRAKVLRSRLIAGERHWEVNY